MAGTFSIRGSTIWLLLPDGRIAIVNCDIKFAEEITGLQVLICRALTFRQSMPTPD
jgi:hypothetical protein